MPKTFLTDYRWWHSMTSHASMQLRSAVRAPQLRGTDGSKRRGYSMWPEAMVVFTLPFLLTISSFREVRYVSHAIALLMFLSVFRLWVLDPLAIRARRLKSNSWRHDNLGLVLVILFSVWTSLGFLVGVFFGTVSFTGFWFDILSYLALLYFPFSIQKFGIRDDHGVSRLLDVLLFAMVTYLVVNFLLWFVGVMPQVSQESVLGENRLLRLMGMTRKRVTFPISSGLNGMAVVGVCSVCIALASWQRGGHLFRSIVAVLLFGMAISVIALSDSRGAFLAALVVMIIFAFQRHARIFVALPWTFLIFAVLPGLLIATVSLIPDSVIFTLFDRNSSQFRTPIAALTTGRSYIWTSAATLFDPPTWNTLFGYGHYGHIVSGISSQYSWIFGEVGSYSTHTTHSTVVQTFVDRGLVGVALFFAILIYFSRHLCIIWRVAIRDKMTRPDVLAAILLLAALVVCGGTEAVATTYFRDSVFLMNVALAIALTRPMIAAQDTSSIVVR